MVNQETIGGLVVLFIFAYVFYNAILIFYINVWKPVFHRIGFCFWSYERNPYRRHCGVCGRKQEMFEVPVIVGNTVRIVDRWEDV